MLNYGYSLLEAECLRVINSVCLDSHVGFLHEMKLTDEFNAMMNSKVEYRKKNTTWGSVLLLKARN